jgi:hypothetical protein
MKRTNIYLSEDQLTTLQALGDQRGQPVAELVRQAVDEWLRSQGVSVLDEDQWVRRFGSLLGRGAGKRRPTSSAAVDRDVAAAIREVRRGRAARRR